MDPLTFRYLQLIIAEVFGVVLCGAGIFLLLRGLSGKSTFIMEGMGIKARLTNASPGTIVALIGAVIFVISIRTPHLRMEEHSPAGSSAPAQELETWLRNSQTVDGSEKYNQLMDKILGTDPGPKLLAEHIRLTGDASLGSIARTEYHDERFWPLVAAINKDQQYYAFRSATKDTTVKAGSIIEIWRVSKFLGKDQKTIFEISAADRAAAYREILVYATHGHPFGDRSIDEIDRHYKRQELQLVLSPANTSGGITTLGDLSLKYYQDRALWPLIVWSNPGKFPQPAAESTPLPEDQELMILHFL